MANEESSSSEYTLVKKDVVLACCICSICNQIIHNPTTIIVCLHIFCYQCIHDKIVKEKWHNCPKCGKFIGINPLSKLRPNPLKMCVRDDPLCEHMQQEKPKRKVIEESSSSSTAHALSLALGGSNVPTKKRSNSNRKKWVMASEGSTDPAVISNPKAQIGCSKQDKGKDKGKGKGKGKGKALEKVVLNFDLNFPPPLESPSRPNTIVFALPSQPVNTKHAQGRRSP